MMSLNVALNSGVHRLLLVDVNEFYHTASLSTQNNAPNVDAQIVSLFISEVIK